MEGLQYAAHVRMVSLKDMLSKEELIAAVSMHLCVKCSLIYIFTEIEKLAVSFSNAEQLATNFLRKTHLKHGKVRNLCETLNHSENREHFKIHAKRYNQFNNKHILNIGLLAENSCTL